MHSWIRSVGLLSISGVLFLPGSMVEAKTTQKSTQQYVQPVAHNVNQSKLTKEQAFSLASEFVKEWPSMNPVLSDSSFKSNEDTDSSPTWSFTWESSDNIDRRKPYFLLVEINANSGELINYSFSHPSLLATKGKEPISLEKAQQVAEAFLRKHAGKKLSSISLKPTPVSDDRTALTSTEYYFTYQRQINGIPFPEDSITVRVSPNGTIVSYYFTWSEDLNFPPDSKKISLEEATKTFKESPFITLRYNVPYPKETEVTEPQLIYDYDKKLAIDANTGKFLEEPSSLISSNPDKRSPVVDKPLPPLHKGTPLTQAQAIELAKKLMSLENWKLTQASYQKNIEEGSSWELSFEKKKQNDRIDTISLTIDAKNGNVLNYTLLPSLEEKMNEDTNKTPIAPEKLQKLAIDTVQRLAPYKAQSLYLDTVDHEDEPRYDGTMKSSFKFQRYIHGIIVSEGAGVYLDQKTGELLSFYSTISQDSFPQKLPTYLSLEEAKEKWLQQLEVKLTYQMNEEDNSEKKQQASNSQPLTLTYTLQPSNQKNYTLDAVTGKWINFYTNKPVEVNRTEPEDLHKLPTDRQKALRIMYEYNAIELIDGQIKPKEPIKRSEIIKMLVAIISNVNYDDDFIPKKPSFHDVPTSSPYFGAIEYALERGYISPSQNKTLQPEKPITRAELAESFTRALGYHSLAELPNLFVASATDTANVKEKGSISIVTALGIMETTNQSFKPDAPVTREEAAIYFQKFLEAYNKKAPEESLFIKSRY
ncbi:S-layer homology domain-containing protein [Brevibacillus laterosporus]|uniref:YcdB/YcdC domain-containing protein n=1 Tax=Brevibacillus laterosporus TaxID=1465 RepID=UPI00036D8C68|nr:YcdB/YcdC domain-containing protein [Brevibacillus laterosporus]ATO48682.1 peptidase [Brevibacillus laterosporus DSM 25]MED2003663.1 S-layer homology domain-containing protein [Brevibacillus laterosporus]